MVDARASQRLLSLRAWMSELEAPAVRDVPWSAERWPSPPGDLTPEDCAAAGFKFYEEGCARSVLSALTFQVNFSPDLQHQTWLVWNPRRSSDALLWVDRELVPVPVDWEGKPWTQGLARWLDWRFSKGFLSRVDHPAHALRLSSWISEVGKIARTGPTSFNAHYPPPPTGLRPEELEALGFGFYGPLSAHSFLDETANSTVRIDLSPDIQHQAVAIEGPQGWSGALLWVDADALPVPRLPNGNPLCERGARWIDNRFVYAPVGGPADHPAFNPATLDPLSNLRGLLIWDALKRVPRIELPEPTQLWTDPVLVARDSAWVIYASEEALKADRPDRVLPIPA